MLLSGWPYHPPPVRFHLRAATVRLRGEFDRRDGASARVGLKTYAPIVSLDNASDEGKTQTGSAPFLS